MNDHMGDPKEPEWGPELHRDNLRSEGAIFTLGVLASQALRELGEVTFIVRPDGNIAYANPEKVYIEHDAVPDPELLKRPFRVVRPVLTDGRARLVKFIDGKPWEIEFTDEPETTAG
jgi:hypothetical protein